MTCSVTAPVHTQVPCKYEQEKDPVNTVVLSNVTNITLTGGSFVSFEINGIINPRLKAKNPVSTIVWTADNTSHVIDFKESDLFVTASCDYPCGTCHPDDPKKCTSCALDSKYPLFWQGNCVQECP